MPSNVGAQREPQAIRWSNQLKLVPLLQGQGQAPTQPFPIQVALSLEKSGHASFLTSSVFLFSLNAAAEIVHAAKRRRKSKSPSKRPTLRIARRANSEHDDLPVCTRYAQQKPLCGETYRW